MKVKATGVCHCGMDMDDHTGWDNHAPLDMAYTSPPDTWFRRRREELEFLWDVVRTVAYAIRKRMW